MNLVRSGLFLITATLILGSFQTVSAQFNFAVSENREIDWERGPEIIHVSRDELPPNIVLILADDLGWNDLSFNGGGVAGGTVPTPNIDSIAKDGALFMNGYSACGTCAPSRASIMSGRYPTRFGFEFTPTPPNMMPLIASQAGDREPPLITHFEERESVPYDQMGMPAEEITLAEVLKSREYHAVHIGKWHLGRTHGMAPHEQGFDESLLMHSGLYLPQNDPNVVNSKQDFDPIDRFLWMAMRYSASFNGGEPFAPRGYLTDYYTEEAVKVIEANRNRPFFLYLAHWAPHTPLQATREDYDALSHIDDHIERVYAAMIRALDRGVGQVLDALRENGLDDNTLVIFTSDNGAAGYLGVPHLNDPYRGWKMSHFEGGIHVPYFMKWPGTIPAGMRFEPPVHHFDIFATAAAVAGAELPDDRKMDGKNLIPHLVSDNVEAPHEHLFWKNDHYQVVTSGGWKMQRAERPNKVWLFDLNNDPTEQINLADEFPERVQAMHKLLDAHAAEQAEPIWPALMEAPNFIDKHQRQATSPDDEHIYWPN